MVWLKPTDGFYSDANFHFIISVITATTNKYNNDNKWYKKQLIPELIGIKTKFNEI